jgi:long-chain acyl-CoA synthetase
LTEKSINGIFFAQAEKFKDDPFMWSKFLKGVPATQWVPVTWHEAAEEARDLGSGLIELGFKQGERAAIFAPNRPRWILADQAIQGSGGIGVPIYPTSTDEQLRFILKDCGARAVFAGDGHLLAQVLRVKPNLPALQYIVAMSPADDPDPSVVSYDSLLKRGRESSSARAEYEKRRRALTGDDVAAIIYTSGTTGEPKGAALTQRNFTVQNEMLLDSTITNKMIERGVRMSSLCHLPLCHIYGRTSDYHVQMAMGGQIWFAESYQKVPANLLEVRPQMLITIPRLYEKVYEMVMVNAGKLKGFRKKIFDWSLRVGNEVVDYLSTGRPLPTPLALQFALAGVLVYETVKKAAGLDRLVFAGSGGGALSEDTNRFFRSMNVQVGEGYGLTETASALTWNGLEFLTPVADTRLNRTCLDWLIDTMVVMQGKGRNPFTHPVGMVKMTVAAKVIIPKLIQKPGTVGRACKYTEIRLAEDGEILAKGPQVFNRELGYFNRPDLTAEAFSEDGFFKTGDIGEFDADGFLRITDRKKELLVTAGGKNVAPHPIELMLTFDTFIEQACVIGDAKKYISALLVPQFEILEKWARDQGLSFQTREELIELPEVLALFQEKVIKVNERLARYEQIKKFRLLPVSFSEETGELTPTQKIKRRVVHKKFEREIDSLYEG